MVKILFPLLSILLLSFSTNVYAKATPCSTLDQCVGLVSKLTGQKYIYDKKLKGQVFVTRNFKVTKQNADRFLSDILYQNGYTRVPTFGGNYQIINARDVRYSPMPIYKVGKDEIPNTSDFIMVSYSLKHPFRSTGFTRNLRPFMSRYGRIIDLKDAGTILIQDTAKNVTRMLKIIKPLDVKPSEDEAEKREVSRKHWQELEKLRAKNCAHLQNQINDIKNELKRISK